MQVGRSTTAELSAAMVLAFCGIAAGQGVSRSLDESEPAPRIAPPPKADTDSDEMRIAPAIVCFAAGTDARYVAAIEQIVKQRNEALFGGIDYFTGSRWTGVAGTPVTIRWSFVPDGVSISSGTGEMLQGQHHRWRA